MPQPGLVLELDLHARHVHPCRAVTFAAFATDAQVHRLAHFGACKSIGPELARKGQTQQVGTAAREVHFIARDAKTGAHGARIELAAVPVVVAHLHGFGQAARAVTARAGRADFFGRGVVLYVPGRPVERRLQHDGFVRARRACGWKAKQRSVVHLGRVDDAVGAEQVARVQLVFDGGKSLVDARPELPTHPFATTQAIAMLAAVGALKFAHQGCGFLRDGAHLDGTVTPHVEDGPHVQGADRCMCVPSAACAMTRKHVAERGGVVGQVLQGHGAVFYEAHRFAVALQAHHDVEACFAHFPQGLLRCFVGQFDHAVR